MWILKKKSTNIYISVRLGEQKVALGLRDTWEINFSMKPNCAQNGKWWHENVDLKMCPVSRSLIHLPCQGQSALSSGFQLVYFTWGNLVPIANQANLQIANKTNTCGLSSGQRGTTQAVYRSLGRPASSLSLELLTLSVAPPPFTIINCG